MYKGDHISGFVWDSHNKIMNSPQFRSPQCPSLDSELYVTRYIYNMVFGNWFLCTLNTRALLAAIIIRPQINLNQTLGALRTHANTNLVFISLLFTPDRRFSMFTPPTKAIKMSNCFLLIHLQREILHLRWTITSDFSGVSRSQ